jgi:hypothetical protein
MMGAAGGVGLASRYGERLPKWQPFLLQITQCHLINPQFDDACLRRQVDFLVAPPDFRVCPKVSHQRS